MSHFNHIIPSLGLLHRLYKRKFLRSERNLEPRTPLELHVDAVDETHLSNLREHVHEQRMLHQFLVRIEERTTQTRQTSLHQSLNSGVLHDVEKGLRGTAAVASVHLADGIHKNRSASRSEQSVSSLVTREHIVKIIAHALPTREHQTAALGVEIRGLSRGHMLHSDVFRRHEASENGLGVENGASNCGRIHTLNIPEKGGYVNPKGRKKGPK